MLPTSKITDSETAPPIEKPALPAELSQPSLLSRVVCDLAECAAFSPGYKGPHVPVAAAFGGDRFHECRISGCFDLDRALAENSKTLFRSIRRLDADDSAKAWDDLTFKFGPKSFLYADENRIVGYAETSQAAESMVAKFNEAYRKPPPPKGGSFYLIRTGRDISSEVVPLGLETILDDRALSLHYGTGSGEWHEGFIAKLRESGDRKSVV